MTCLSQFVRPRRLPRGVNSFSASFTYSMECQMSRFLLLAFLVASLTAAGCSGKKSVNMAADATQEQLDEYARLVAESEIQATEYKLVE